MMTKALKGAGYVSVDEDIDGIADKVLRNKKMEPWSQRRSPAWSTGILPASRRMAR